MEMEIGNREVFLCLSGRYDGDTLYAGYHEHNGQGSTCAPKQY